MRELLSIKWCKKQKNYSSQLENESLIYRFLQLFSVLHMFKCIFTVVNICLVVTIYSHV